MRPTTQQYRFIGADCSMGLRKHCTYGIEILSMNPNKITVKISRKGMNHMYIVCCYESIHSFCANWSKVN